MPRLDDHSAGWRFEKRVTLGDVLSALAMLMLGLVAYYDLRERVSVVELQQHVQEQRDNAQDVQATRFASEIWQDLRDIKASVERIAERVGSRPAP